MHIRKLTRESFTEYYVTAYADPSQAPCVAAEELFAELGAVMRRHEILPLQEKIYGATTLRADVLETRQKALRRTGLDSQLPCTYLDGRADGSTGLLAVQLWGIVPTDGKTAVSSVSVPSGGTARLCKGPAFDMLYIPAVTGTTSVGGLPRGVTAQSELMFANAEEALRANGFSFAHVVRTWYYLRRILDWYGEFNNVRNKFFAHRGITGELGAPYPASTGIQGTSAGEECIVDVLAVRPTGRPGFQARPLTLSSRQNPSMDYGSAFSRGMTFEIDGKKTLLVSGTASICPGGETLHLGDRQGQIVETLLSIAALIEPEGARLADICAGTLFYKDEESLQTYLEVQRILGVADLPLVHILADVCRPELLVEIEAVVQIDERRPAQVQNDRADMQRVAGWLS